MGKPKTATGTDPMGQHARIYKSIIKSRAWIALSYSARALYVQLRCNLNSHNNGQLTCTLAEFKHAGFRSSSTLRAGLRDLEAVGLIEKTAQGGLTRGGKSPCRYRFTDQLTIECTKHEIAAKRATKDWERFEALSDAKAAIRAAAAACKRGHGSVREIDSKLRSSNRSASKNVH
jgi:hypothetical protein